MPLINSLEQQNWMDNKETIGSNLSHISTNTATDRKGIIDHTQILQHSPN